MGQLYGSRLPTRFNAARRDSPGSVKKKLERKCSIFPRFNVARRERRDQPGTDRHASEEISSLQCGPARIAGINSSSAACVGIEYTARFNVARRERRDQRELERFVTALP